MEPDEEDDGSGDSGVVGDGYDIGGCPSSPKIESKEGGLADWPKALTAVDMSSREGFSEEQESVSR